MIRVNNKNFNIYDFDTQDSISARIAVDSKTIPKYIYKRGTDVDIIMEDLLEVIINDAKENIDFDDFKKSIANKIPKNDFDIKKDILYIWISFNLELERLSKINPVILDDVADRLVQQDYLTSKDEFDKIWKDKENIKTKLRVEIDRHSIELRKYNELFIKFSELKETIPYTDFITEKLTVSFNIETKLTLIEVFNTVVTNKNVPFVSYLNYYKILKNFIPSQDWSNESLSYMLLKVNSKISDEPSYINVVIAMSEEKVPECIFELIIDKTTVSKDILIERIISCIESLGNINNVSENDMGGLFFIPDKYFNSYVFSDLVMMDNTFMSNMVTIDEFTKPTKKNAWIYMHFNHINTGLVKCSVIQKMVDFHDSEAKFLDKAVFKEGDPYIRIHVTKAKTKQSIETFQKMFSKILVYYDGKYDEIKNEYVKYIPDFGTEVKSIVKKKKKKLDVEDVFPKNYSRTCKLERMPTVISDKKAKKYIEQGRQVIRFPRDVMGDNPYNSDGVNPKNYACKNEKYKFPGLQKNKLENSEDYPFLPCCYVADQTVRSGNYSAYYDNTQVESKVKKQQNLISTDKFLEPNKFGELSTEMKNLFELLDGETGYKYLRIGVERNESSFLTCVMTALYEKSRILDFEGEEKLEKIREVRNELALKQHAPACKQMRYDTNIKEIIRDLKDENHYIDPKLYIQLLENYFQCNIYIFNTTEMLIPRYKQSYYRSIQEGPHIFIYEHMGSESDHARYPQCELIIKWNTDVGKDVKYKFTSKDSIAVTVNVIFTTLIQSYVLNRNIRYLSFEISLELLAGQVIDSYGKTRRVDIKYNGGKMSLLTSPIQPLLTVELKRDRKLNKVAKEVALKFFNEIEECRIFSQTVLNGVLKEISATIGVTDITIPVFDSEPIPDIKTDIYLHYKEEDVSLLITYNRNKKIARYLCEYIFWLFSKYLKQNQLSVITDKTIKKFSDITIAVDQNHKYRNFSNMFDLNSTCMNEGKLILTSKELEKRLLYVLKMYSMQNLPKLLDYNNRQYIERYYEDINDFDVHDNQILLEGEDSIFKLIQESSINHLLNDTVIMQTTPYFFRNTLISKDIFLAQNTNTIGQAIQVGKTWNRKHYNNGQYSRESDPDCSFNFYSFVNSTTMRNISVEGKENVDVTILGYKIHDAPFYTVLLKIS